jgi:site-specific recombinase XerD
MAVRGYQDRPTGRLAYAKVGKEQRTKLFPPATDPDIIAKWRVEQRLALKHRQPAEGTLAADVERYLRLRSTMPSYSDRVREIGSWLPRFGNRSRHEIEHTQIAAQANEWIAAGSSASTVKHRLNALSNLYRLLDGKLGRNPVRDVPRPVEPDAEDRALPMALARQIIAQIQERTASAVRAQILLNTGMRCGELGRLATTDVRLEGPEPFVSIRTLKGGKNRRVPLNASAIAAFRIYRARDLWGKFSASSLRHSLHRACAKVQDEEGKPAAPIHPHVLRHTFASWLVNDGRVSLKTAQRMLGHRKIQTTVRYVREDEAQARLALKQLDAAG